MGKADLHIHTTASDGAYTPKNLLKYAKEKGLETISITDHDTIKGYLAGKPVAEELGIELLAGVENTVIWKGREVHLLAYCFDEEDSALLSLLHKQSSARKKRMEVIVDKLREQGVDINVDEVKAEARSGNIGRPHAAEVLISKGYVATVNEAFIRYLSFDKLDEVKTEYATIDEVVAIFKDAGGVLSLAHPGPLYSGKEVEELVSLGIDGIECIHPSHRYKVQRAFTQMASEKGLLVTGGSDFHGKGTSEYDPYFGIVTVGEQHVASLKRLAKRRIDFQN